VSFRTGTSRINSGESVAEGYVDSTIGAVNATRPFTWGTSDFLLLAITYEADG
jgi:hypothetical protein